MLPKSYINISEVRDNNITAGMSRCIALCRWLGGTTLAGVHDGQVAYLVSESGTFQLVDHKQIMAT